MIRFMQREINELDETENWKLDVDEDEEEEILWSLLKPEGPDGGSCSTFVAEKTYNWADINVPNHNFSFST